MIRTIYVVTEWIDGHIIHYLPYWIFPTARWNLCQLMGYLGDKTEGRENKLSQWTFVFRWPLNGLNRERGE